MEKEKAREFCRKVKELADQYGLNVFVVTDGASLTSSKDKSDDNCILMHRKVQTFWELKKGIDPTEKWS